MAGTYQPPSATTVQEHEAKLPRTGKGQFHLEQLQDLDSRSAVVESLKLRGVGRWTAEYVLLRGLGRVDAFPGDDVGARNRLALWLGRDLPLDYEGVQRVVKR